MEYHVLCRCCSMILSSTGPWTPWRLCTCSRDRRMRLTSALHSTLIHKNAKEMPGARLFPSSLLASRFSCRCGSCCSGSPSSARVSFFILPAVMTRVLTKWLSVFWWGFRRSWRVLRREQCSAWEGRWTSSYSRPWTLKIWADSFLDGSPGCKGSSMFSEETYFDAANVLTFQIGISQLSFILGFSILVFGRCWGFFFFNNMLLRKHFLSISVHRTAPTPTSAFWPFFVPCKDFALAHWMH